MESSFVKKVITNLFAFRADIFGDGSTFVGFESKNSHKNGNLVLQDGFNSIQYYGKIVYEDEDGIIQKSDPVMIKITPKVTLSKFISFSFVNELIFFTKILPVLSNREVSLFPLFPKFYYGEVIFGVEKDCSAIILENLKFRGYKMANKKSFLDYQHLSLMMRKLGQFHAYSYKAKSTIPHVFHSLANNYLETCPIVNGEWPNSLEITGQRGLKYLMQDSHYSSFIERISEMISNAKSIFNQVLTEDKNNPVSVIVHGDYLRNNVMFKYENNSTPDDLVIIDMATFRYGSPLIDLITVLYLHTDQKMRDDHWHDLIDEYYISLKNTFPEIRVPGKDEILADFVDKSFYGYLVASYFLPFLIADDNKTGFNGFDKYFLPSDEIFNSDVDIEAAHMKLISESTCFAGGDEATKALSDILRDMVNRGFIRKFNC